MAGWTLSEVDTSEQHQNARGDCQLNGAHQRERPGVAPPTLMPSKPVSSRKGRKMPATSDSTLDFELRCFVSGIQNFRFGRHDLNKAIDAAFRLTPCSRCDIQVSPRFCLGFGGLSSG